MDLGGQSRVVQQSGLPEPLLDPLVECAKVARFVVTGVALHLYWNVLELSVK